MKKFKFWMAIAILSVGIIAYFNGGSDYLNFNYMKEHLDQIKFQYQTDKVFVAFFFFCLYLAIATLSIPGCLILTILSGAIFGTLLGTLIVSAAASLGALLAFFMSRYLLRDFIREKFFQQFTQMNSHIKKDAALYLLTLRLIPASPFVVINLVMGLTAIPVKIYFWVTLVGIFPGNLIYSYAGRKISMMNSPSDIMTPGLIISLSFLGVLPFLLRYWMRKRKISSNMPPG